VRKGRPRPPAVPTPWRSLSANHRQRTEGGFTLIELIIVSLVIPIIIGAITLALISIFSLQGGVSGRLSGSGDAQIVSTNFETDVQNGSEITTDPSGLSPQCAPASQVSGSTQVLGVQTGQAVISYEEVPEAGTSTQQYSLFRYACQNGSATPTSSTVVSSDIPAGQTVSVTCAATLETALAGGTTTLTVSPLPLAVTINDTIQLSNVGSAALSYVAAANALPGATTLSVKTATAAFATGSQVVDSTSWTAGNTNCGASTGWISTSGVTGVTFGTTEPGTNPYTFKVVAVPRPSAPLNQPTLVAQPNSSCVFASGKGYYTSNLCFVNFSLWNSYTGSSSAACTQGGLAMSAAISNTGYTLSFCLIVQSVSTGSGSAVTGPIGNNAGYNGVAAATFPTYGESFLGNNLFYTVSDSVSPALYQQVSGMTTTVNIYNIGISSSAGTPVTGWELVTGDAETTDSSESMTWTSSAGSPFSLLWNTPGSSAIGGTTLGACSNPTSPDGLTPQSLLTGGTAGTVECASSVSVSSPRDGTVMLEALTPSTLNVTMVGSGLEAMFMGILLPSAS
jgi:prepilin-type N-terminal cleavage/methylation domain-containing protein